MKYLTGIHALNINCSLDTCGDWHQSALRWDDETINKRIKDTSISIFGNYGIEQNHDIPLHEEKYNVANTLRALLDLLEDGMFYYAQGANNDFICNKKYNNEFFQKVYLLHKRENWPTINEFMKKEFGREWQSFLKEV